MKITDYSNFPTQLPVLVEDELFIYPFMITPIFINDTENEKAIEEAINNNTLIMVVGSFPENEGKRDFDYIYKYGVVGNIMRKVSLPDGRIKVLFQGMQKARITKPISKEPLKAMIELVEYVNIDKVQENALMSILKDKLKLLASIDQSFPIELLKTVDDNLDKNRTIDLISSSINVRKSRAIELFRESNLEKRFMSIIAIISEKVEALKLKKDIKNKVNSKIDKVNKEYYLKEQLKQIQDELGIDTSKEDEIQEYKDKLEKIEKFMSEDAIKEINKVLKRYERMGQDSSDSHVLQTYLESVFEIPFGEYAKASFSVEKVHTQLEKDHYALKEPKERIEEYFAVQELVKIRKVKESESRGVILCLIGPPGVGKTSLANSIAKATKRKLARVALGGLEDVNEIRGHRRTYVGAMAGRIAQSLVDAKEMNPVMVLDEIDKIGTQQKGDPTSVLLEVLDPEQNKAFRDYYLNFSIDLSKVMFIATANDIGGIPGPLRDRMEFIEVSSYTPQEKYNIAKKYLLPQEMKKHALTKDDISISTTALKEIISGYTREAGVRNLRRIIGKVCRKVVKDMLANKEEKKISVTLKNIVKYLDSAPYEDDKKEKKDIIGQVNGLGWSSVGGSVLKVEVVQLEGKGNLQITGSLGDVMKESSKIAYSVVKRLIETKKLKSNVKDLGAKIKKLDLHLHFPEGATPKDGPSAGITISCAIASVLTERKVRSHIAMTGEVTLLGNVLPIGGLKEKLIAAHKAGITLALVPRKNFENDLKEIPDEVKKDMEIVGVDHVTDVIDKVLYEVD